MFTAKGELAKVWLAAFQSKVKLDSKMIDGVDIHKSASTSLAALCSPALLCSALSLFLLLVLARAEANERCGVLCS